MDFKCSYQWPDGIRDYWYGRIVSFNTLPTLYELNIQSRSGLRVLVGKYSGGNFACIPSHDVGCYLSHLGDLFYNSERLIKVLNNHVDGHTVAQALKLFSDKIVL